MTTLVLGAIGGVIGGFFGGPVGAQIGYLAGSLLGSLLDPPKTAGPRLGDTKLQRSTYGAMIPYCWGAGRIGTIVIDQTDLVEHENTTDSGKGGAETTNFTYSASWIAALCMRLPNSESAIAGISHLFLDGRLIWASNSDGDAPCEVITGTETQTPDADFEAINGVGQQPAYRGMAYLKFKDFVLTDYGNRIPNVEAVVFTSGLAGDFPTRVGDEFAPWGNDTPTHPYLNKFGFTSSYTGGLITTSWTFVNGSDQVEMWVEQHLLNGTVIMMPTIVYTGAVGTRMYYSTACTNTHQWFYVGPGPSTFGWVKLFYSVGLIPNGNYAQGSLIKSWSAGDNDDVAGLIAYPNSMAASNVQSTKLGVLYYTARQASNPCVIVKSESFPIGEIWKHLADLDPDGGLYSASDVSLGLGTDDQTLYAMAGFAGGTKMWRWGGRGDYFWDVTDTAGTALKGFANFFVYQNRWVVFHDNNAHIRVVQINVDETLEDVGSALIEGISTSDISWLGSIYGIDGSGVFKLGGLGGGPVLLSQIVDDLASMTPALTYDNSALTDEVRWYLVGSQMTVRNALEKLRASFFFDIVEVDYSLVAYKRGEGTVYTIPDDDLDAREYGTEPGDPLKTERKREQELPRTITMTYIDVDLDWQTGAQASPRQVTQSQYDVSLEVAIGFTAQEAAQKCWSIQAAEWMERESFAWSLSREYSWLHPAMLVKVRGRDIRIVKITESPMTGVMLCEGVLAAPSVYTQVAPGAPSQGGGSGGSQGGPPGSGTGPSGSPGSGGSGGGGGNPGDPGYRQPPPGSVGTDPWLTVFVDCPALHANDAPFGFYMSVGNSYGAYYWGGADLYRTTDQGTTWHYLGTKKGSSVMCALSGPKSVTGEPDHPFTDLNSTYAGGDVTQEVILIIQSLTPPQALLTSSTEAGLDLGANIVYMSKKPYWGNPYPAYSVTERQEWECLQFRDVIQLQANVWKVTGWRRGRRGTPVLDHDGGCVIFFPESVSNIPDVQENLGITFSYKAVPYGLTVTQTPAVQFTNFGQSGGGSNGGGGGVVVPPTVPGGGNTPGTGTFDTIALNFPITVIINTTTSRTMASGDRASLVTFNNASTTTVTLPDTLPKKWWCFIENVGVGDVVLVPTGGSPFAKLDNSALALTVSTNKGCLLVYDGQNFWTSRGMGSAGTSGGVDMTNAPVYTAGPFAGLQHARELIAGSGITFTDGGGSPPSTTTVAKLNDYIVLSPAYAATVTVDLTNYATYGHIQVDVGALTGNLTLNITNGTNGQIIRVRLLQDGTGGRTLSSGANIYTSTDLPLPVLSTAANAIDFLGFQYDLTNKARLVAYVRGFV